MRRKQEFKDYDSNGKDRKWKERKLQNIELGRRLEVLGYKAFARVYQCAEVLNFKMKQSDGKLKLKQAWFCKSKLCPMCNWRRSMKYGAQIGQIIDVALKRYPKARFVFLTLTVKNVSGEELGDELRRLTKSFDRLFRRAKVKRSLIGYLRSVEITYNSKRDDYHPHIHVLLMLKSSYFNSKDNYIKQAEWADMWKQSAKLDYMPIVDVRNVKPNERKSKNEMDLRGAIVETAKYPIKPIEIMGQNEEQKLKITDDLMQALNNKRQIGFGGLFREIRKELQLEDVEEGDLVHIDDDEEVSEGVEIVAYWNWNRLIYEV